MKIKNIYNYDYLKELIKDYLKKNNTDINELVKVIGISKETFNKSINNKREFYLTEIYKLSEVLGLTKEQIEIAFFNNKGSVTNEK